MALLQNIREKTAKAIRFGAAGMIVALTTTHGPVFSQERKSKANNKKIPQTEQVDPPIDNNAVSTKGSKKKEYFSKKDSEKNSRQRKFKIPKSPFVQKKVNGR